MRWQKVGFSILAIGLSSDASFGNEPANDDFGMVAIGDVGNIGYPGGPGDIMAGRGSVDYEYRIGRTQITTGQWLEFFNIFGTQSDELATLLLPSRWSCRRDFSYQGPGRRYEYLPVEFVWQPELSYASIDWRQAAMYCNWMHNGQSNDSESLFDGVYDTSTFTQNDDGSFNDQSVRNPDAKYWIPNLDEYIKAAYYDPNKEGLGPGWWDYPHSSDEPPIHDMPGIGHVARGLTEEQLVKLSGNVPSATRVPLGVYEDVRSPWGLLDVLGGASEFVENWHPQGFRTDRMGKMSSNLFPLEDSSWDQSWRFELWFPQESGGFRIAGLVFHPADLNEDWHVNFFDISVFISNFVAGDLAVDFDGDGSLGFLDVIYFLEIFSL